MPNYLPERKNFLSLPPLNKKATAGVAYLAAAPDLGSGAERRVGSSPITRTVFKIRLKCKKRKPLELVSEGFFFVYNSILQEIQILIR